MIFSSTIRLLHVVFCICFITSCSQPTPTPHHQRYLDAADSLTLYQRSPYLQKELASNEKSRDLLEMSYNEFKEKYNWDDQEMDHFSNTIQGHIRIAKTLDTQNNIVETEE